MNCKLSELTPSQLRRHMTKQELMVLLKQAGWLPDIALATVDQFCLGRSRRKQMSEQINVGEFLQQYRRKVTYLGLTGLRIPKEQVASHLASISDPDTAAMIS